MLKFLSRVKIEFNAFDPRTASCMEFLAQCNSRKAKESNPACEVEVKRVNVEHPPQITVTFVNGVVEAFDATSTPAHNITVMILKKGQLLETEQMFREAEEQWPVIIPDEEISQYAPGTKARALVSSFTRSLFASTTIAAALNRPVSQAMIPSLSPANRFGGIRYRWQHLPDANYDRWLIIMDKPGGEGASRKHIIDCFVQTLAKVTGSEEEAKKKIFKVACEKNPLTKYNFGFGCEIDEETAKKLKELPGVLFVLPVPDSYDNYERKNYGGNFGNSAYSPDNLGWGNFSNHEMATLFHGCDYNHWLIRMTRPGKGVSDQEMIDRYVQTLAKVVGSEEEAKKKIYNVCCQKDVAFFGCEVDMETSKKLAGMPGVLKVFADSYADPVHKDYGAELFVNGEIVERSPERERMVGTKYVFDLGNINMNVD